MEYSLLPFVSIQSAKGWLTSYASGAASVLVHEVPCTFVPQRNEYGVTFGYLLAVKG